MALLKMGGGVRTHLPTSGDRGDPGNDGVQVVDELLGPDLFCLHFWLVDLIAL